MLEYPPILRGTTEQQIAALRDYLVRQVNGTQEAEPHGWGMSAQTSQAQQQAALAQQQAMTRRYDELRAMIARKHGIYYAQVDAGSTSSAMTATAEHLSKLEPGTAIWLHNGVVTSASGFTLNVNGLGALPCYSSLASATRATTVLNIGYTMLLIYNAEGRGAGPCWDVCYGYDSNSIGYQLRTNSATLPMAKKLSRYRLLFTAADGQKWVPATESTSTNATAARAVCQEPIDPHGRIVYYGTSATIAAGSSPNAAYLWSQYTLTLGYSFNRTGSALALAYPKPVYIKAAPQTGGSAIIDPDAPVVQELPTTADGKIYIFLGYATNATTVEIVPEHPIYHYKDNALRRWTGPV